MKPCIVIGSGFHSWVLGKSDTALSNWHILIDEVAEAISVAIPSYRLSPVLRWEKLLENASNDGFRQSASGSSWIHKRTKIVSEIEPYAKLALKSLLDKYTFQYPSNSSRSLFPLEAHFETVISLNFDHCWIGNTGFTYHSSNNKAGYEKLYQNEIDRLHNYITKESHPSSKIWYPNGSVSKPDTIRMGLYDYGTKPFAIKEAFNNIKSFEKFTYRQIESNSWEMYKPKLEDAINNNDSRVNNWVTDFLYRPIYFAGTGLSESEIGLWWLLAQRARNFAHLNPRERPPTVVLLNENDSRRDFWANRPCGVEPLICSDWDIGWEMIIDRVDPPPISGGVF